MEYFGRTPSAQWSSACYYERLGGWHHGGAAGITADEQGFGYEELAEKYVKRMPIISTK
jgi:hypothetical protein